MVFAIAQTSFADSFRLRNKSMLEFRFSMKNYDRQTYYDDIYGNSFDDSKLTIGLSHWNSENSAITFSIAASEVDNVLYEGDYSLIRARSYIVPIFWGTRFYLTDNRGYSPIKPYLAVSAGPVLGVVDYQDINNFIDYEEDLYVTFGTQIGGGVDFMFGNRMMLGVSGSYNLYGDFKEYLGERDNYSGAEIGVSFGYLFGGESEKERTHIRKRKKRVVKF